MKWFVVILLFSFPCVATTERKPESITISDEIRCGLRIRSGVDDNFNNKLDVDEVIFTMILCNKDRDYDKKNPMAKTIIRTQGK